MHFKYSPRLRSPLPLPRGSSYRKQYHATRDSRSRRSETALVSSPPCPAVAAWRHTGFGAKREGRGDEPGELQRNNLDMVHASSRCTGYGQKRSKRHTRLMSRQQRNARRRRETPLQPSCRKPTTTFDDRSLPRKASQVSTAFPRARDVVSLRNPVPTKQELVPAPVLPRGGPLRSVSGQV